jgi:hypothetical protein
MDDDERRTLTRLAHVPTQENAERPLHSSCPQQAHSPRTRAPPTRRPHAGQRPPVRNNVAPRLVQYPQERRGDTTPREGGSLYRRAPTPTHESRHRERPETWDPTCPQPAWGAATPGDLVVHHYTYAARCVAHARLASPSQPMHATRSVSTRPTNAPRQNPTPQRGRTS